MATAPPSLLSTSAIDLMEFKMTKVAGQPAMKEADVPPANIKVCELHDCFSANEMITIETLGLSPPGEADLLVRSGGITYRGQVHCQPVRRSHLEE